MKYETDLTKIIIKTHKAMIILVIKGSIWRLKNNKNKQMKYKTLILLLVVNNLVGFGQNKRTHIVELLPNTTETIENVKFYISDIYDNRVYKTNIGIAQKGVFNKKVLSVFKRSFKDELSNYLETVFPVDTSKTPIVIRINKLLISEHTGAFKETGKAIVSMDVLIENEGEYGLIGSFSAMREKNSMDVTRKHDDRIRAVLKECLMQFNTTNWKDIIPAPTSLEKSGASKILTENYKEGFYRSSLELFNNQTLIDTTFQIVKKKSKKDKIFLRNEKKKSALYYAYSDGKDLYLNAANYSSDRHFIKTYKFDEFLLFNDVFVNQDKAVGMSLAFGVLGVLVSTERQNVLMDLNTGEFFPLNKSKMKLLLEDKYPNLLKQFKSNSKEIKKVLEILNYVYKKENKNELRALLRSE